MKYGSVKAKMNFVNKYFRFRRRYDMKTWNTPELNELAISETAHNGFSTSHDGPTRYNVSVDTNGDGVDDEMQDITPHGPVSSAKG